MFFSNRIKAICNMLAKSTTVADIGCDHGYSSIYIIQEKKADKVIACDINISSIKKAVNNINKLGLTEKIEIRKSNGFLNIRAGEICSAIISGMGGKLIIDILNNSVDLVKSLEQIVIQPQHDLYFVRQHIHKIGLKIDDEQMIYENNIFYNILSIKKGIESKEYAEKDYLLGKILIDKQDPVFKQYVANQLLKQQNIIDKLHNVNSCNSTSRLNEVTNINNIYKEVYKCL